VRTVESSEPVVYLDTNKWLVGSKHWPAMADYFTRLRPLEAVQQAVSATASKFGPSAAGVHVRRGDFGEYLERLDAKLPSLEMYFGHLDAWPGTIFLASDGGAEIEDAFRTRYGDRVITHPKLVSGRNSPEAIRDALADLYLLTKCQMLVGTRYSSFSDLATKVAGAPYVKI